jgi:hypothetical protein
MKNAQTGQPREGSADGDAFFNAHLTEAIMVVSKRF